MTKQVDLEKLTNVIINEILFGIATFTPFSKLSDFARKNIQFQPGDHLVTPRTGYYHHGIYIGNGNVIHYSGGSSNTHDSSSFDLVEGPTVLKCEDITDFSTPSPQKNRFKIEKISIEEFAQGNPINIIEHRDPKYSREESCRRAMKRLNEKKYNLLFNNCEHFVNCCIEGRHVSEQVNFVRNFLVSSLSTLKKNTKFIKTIFTSLSKKAAEIGVIGTNLNIFNITSATVGASLQLASAAPLVYAVVTTIKQEINKRIAAEKREKEIEQYVDLAIQALQYATQRAQIIIDNALNNYLQDREKMLHQLSDCLLHENKKVAALNDFLVKYTDYKLEHENFEQFDKAMQSKNPPFIFKKRK